MKPFRIALSVALLAAATMTFAQTSSGDVVADIPFAFSVAGKTLPPGRYIVNRGNEFYVKIISSESGGVLIPTHAAERSASDGTKLVFHRYGDTYFLSSIWLSGYSTGRELYASSAERNLAKHNSEMEIALVRGQQ